MRLPVLVVLAAAAASTVAASADAPAVPKRRASGQCRVVEPTPKLAPEQTARARRPAPSRTTTEEDARAASSTVRATPAIPPPAASPNASKKAATRTTAAGERSSARRRTLARDPLARGPLYSAARTLDLELGVLLRRDVPPDARVELRVYTPKGHLYQTLRALPPAPTPPGASSRPAAGASRAPSAWTGTLPVAGTAIVNHSLYGEWRVEPHLDGSPRPCGEAWAFRIGQ